ncbi:hypothetical protein QBZ16_000115 [Prototheca wickerhamii]|uniref:Uncharacterized protein n=1 Tax=Prototheca wickerhamii TaxID=3111 RepID=A0AAD9IPJ8_PROWI|nr:hypothetical protein QBZ16_000115 [Prototheca wickerhamii]
MDPTNFDSTSSACTFLQGYNELESLERPLFSSQDEGDDYERAHGVAPPQSHRPAGGRPGGASFSTVGLPTQVDEIRELTVLAKDAAGIMWEMVAMNESGPAAAEMQANAQQLQAQLRGLIGDYQGGDEKLFNEALEALDMLNSCFFD